MRAHLRPALAVFLGLTLLTGLAYPFAVTGLAQALFPAKANGSLVRRGDAVVGSELIGQAYAAPKWLWGRPSATSTPCDASSSSGSNLGPTNPDLAAAVGKRIEALRAAETAANVAKPNPDPIPVELVTASGSGLDPDVSPASARWQAARIAAARGIPRKSVDDLIERMTVGRTLGVLGEPRINVLRFNLALEDLK